MSNHHFIKEIIKVKQTVKIDLYLNRSEFENVQLGEDQVAVVIDVLRASTTIITALDNGCEAVVPIAEVNEAFEMSEKLSNRNVLLGGERNGISIPGFDLSNSPLEYTSGRVSEKTIIFTSTNGSQLFDFSRQAALTIVCGFVNVSSVCDYLLRVNKNIVILCAGRNKQFGLEDAVCGGMLIKEILYKIGESSLLNDGAVAAQILYEKFADNILEMLYRSSHGKRLLEIGQEEDLKICASINSINIVPKYQAGKIIVNKGFRND